MKLAYAENKACRLGIGQIMVKRILGFTGMVFMLSVLGSVAQDDADDPWQPFREADVANVPDGWSTPMRIGANHSNYWEDSPFITGDGETIYFMVYPDADLYTAIASGAGEFVDDIDIYRTHFPFETRELDTRYYLSTDLTSSAWSDGHTSGRCVLSYESSRDARWVV